MNNAMDDAAPSFWSRLGRMFLYLLRFLVVFALIAGIAAAVYFSAPYLYTRFVLPVEKNTVRLDAVERQQAADMQLLSGQVTDLTSRLSSLETGQTQNAQAMTDVQGQFTDVQAALDAQQAAVDGHTETLKQLAVMQASLDALQKTGAEHEALLVGQNSALADVQRQLLLNQSIELLSRARLYLSQSNFGLAKQDVQAAQAALAGLQAEIPTEKEAALQEVVTRLNLALSNLPAFPVLAVYDVDIAWQILINDLSLIAPEPAAGIEIGSTPAVTPSSVSTVTPGPTTTATAAATNDPTITATPMATRGPTGTSTP